MKKYALDHQTAAADSVADASGLNQAQTEAVHHGTGPVLVIAGAGSGKTRTLVHRVAHLVASGVAPENLLLLTFTRRAAQEMLWRAGLLVGQACNRVLGGTFHATANLLLRRHGELLDIGPHFTIIDRADAEGIVNLLRSSLAHSKLDRRFPSKRVLVNIISGAANRAGDIEELVLGAYQHLVDFLDDILLLHEQYQRFKLDHGLMDYDDLLLNWRRLLLVSEEARERVSQRFTHLLVDEYQDTNAIQADIVRLMAHGHDNVMAVGDDAQSIYSFRGADFANILRFPEIFPGTRLIKLEENYRSTQAILDLGNEIIAAAPQRYAKNLFTRQLGGELPHLYAALGEHDEARFVAERIAALVAEGTPQAEIAVLFRSSFHSFKLELELASRGFTCDKRGGLKLTESAHVKDLLAHLRLVTNPWDKLSWNRIFLLLDKVGAKTAQKAAAVLVAEPDPIAALAAYPAGSAWRDEARSLFQTLDRMRAPDLSPAAQFDLLFDYYIPRFERLYHDDFPKRRRDLDQLKAIVGGYGDLQAFLDDTALDPPNEGKDSAGEDEQRLVLSTIHSAKGLEWDCVFIIGLAEGRFPGGNSMAGEGWEEERRLLYVAATRARHQLYLSYPRVLTMADRSQRPVVMSPFLAEVSPSRFQRLGPPLPAGLSRPAGPAMPLPASVAGVRRRAAVAPGGGLGEGQRVRHPFFGIGRVTKVGPGQRAEVFFDRHGEKVLHLEYARLQLLDE
ncbi:MAG: DNA helicase UvrD [Desulfobulbaceae bacterium A2]|nr:MAG: DNA helicase UvrD [Desulfobulbaceae bacterium A2]